MCLYYMDTLLLKFHLKQNILCPTFDIAEQPQTHDAIYLRRSYMPSLVLITKWIFNNKY